MLQLLQGLAGSDATRGELFVWMAIVGAGVGASAWVGFELTRAACKVVCAAAKSVVK
jgi:hypothetical protein